LEALPIYPRLLRLLLQILQHSRRPQPLLPVPLLLRIGLVCCRPQNSIVAAVFLTGCIAIVISFVGTMAQMAQEVGAATEGRGDLECKQLQRPRDELLHIQARTWSWPSGNDGKRSPRCSPHSKGSLGRPKLWHSRRRTDGAAQVEPLDEAGVFSGS